jgi:hypothetical protein
MILGVEEDVDVSPRRSIEELLHRSRRHGFVPVRKAFVQAGGPRNPRPGPLARLVAAGDRVGLDLYLSALVTASKPPHAVSGIAGKAWARIAGVDGARGDQSISRAWGRLERHKLIRRSRMGRKLVVHLLSEDGQGADYVHPSKTGDAYFKLPLTYWSEAILGHMSLAGRAMWLIVADFKDWRALPTERAKEWYGLSADTAQRGLKELVDRNVIRTRLIRKEAPLTSLGYTWAREYRPLVVLPQVSQTEEEVVPLISVS